MPRWGSNISQPLDMDTAFGQRAQGAGNRLWHGLPLPKLRARRPDTDFLGIEVHPGVGNLFKLIGRARRKQSARDSSRCGGSGRQYARAAVAGWLSPVISRSVAKKRHHKRRLVTAGVCRKNRLGLKKPVPISMATDWEEYAQQMLEVLSQNPQLRDTAEGYAARPDFRPLTKFEQRGLNLGHGVWIYCSRWCVIKGKKRRHAAPQYLGFTIPF